MTRNSKTKLSRISVVSIVLLVSAFLVYKYGYQMPGLRENPFFSTSHDHRYKPVINEEGLIEYWTCTMHPSVRLKDPGTCPVCGMQLVPVYEKGKSENNPMKTNDTDIQSSPDMAGIQGHDHSRMNVPSAKRDKNDSPRSVFTVSPERQQQIGVKTEEVIYRSMIKDIRTVGIVELDETKVQYIHTKFTGWIDKVYADYTWKHVKKGDPLFSIYSPELVSTQEEYLLALKSKNILSANEFPEISDGAKSLADATRRRLKLWDISENQIREIERTGKVSKNLVIHSPIEGHVMYKNAFENMYVEPDTRIYTIADHSTVWINADIYENEIQLVNLGQQASITVDSLPGEVIKGKATFIWPHLSAKTRTNKVRFEFSNPDLKLLPEMYANINIEIPMGNRLTVPGSAVLRTGKKDVVIVDKGEGNMELRLVELGHKSNEFYEILRGLEEGEKVVSRANFLIDSESKVQAAIATWQDDTASNTKSGELKHLGDNGSVIPEQDQNRQPDKHIGH